MNHTFRLAWNDHLAAYVPAHESARRRGKRAGLCVLGVALLSSLPVTAFALPDGGQISAGTGGIATSGSTMTVSQQSQNLAINWQSFGIGASESVTFAQPNASAIALNRVLGTDPSQIFGRLSANGQVWLLNPNGVLFGSGAQVNVGGLVASTLNISDADFLAGKRTFSGSGGTVTNQGSISTADGGYVALLGGRVSNEGVIQARLGTVALGAGNQVTLDFAGDQLLNLQVDQGAVNALAENKQLIQADGGTVLLSARAADALLDTVVNNSGIIEARTIDTHNGTIKLLGGMEGGTVQVGGTLDASAPDGGDGGFIETSGAQVKVADSAVVTTTSPYGQTGLWLIDPNDFTIAASGGDITGAALGTSLGSSNVLIQSSSGSTAGAGNVNVNDPVAWSTNTNLTLTASNNVNVNADITASGANAGIALNPNTANGDEAASGSGQFNLGAGAAINLPNVSPSSTTALVINGISYTVINSLGSAGSTTGTDLQGLNGNLAGHYALGSNIDASATSTWSSNAGFAPVGSSSAAFTGVFDGLGHTISGLTINRPTSDYVGLFGYSRGMVRNIGLVGGAFSGNSYVGGLVGHNSGAAARISNSYSTGAVNGSYQYVGGLVGYNSLNGTISNSYSAGAVNGRNGVGGLVGRNDANVTNSHYDIDQVAINGGHYVTLGGLYDAQYQDWVGHGLALNISYYASTLPLDGGSGYYTISTVQGLKDLLGFADRPGYKFRLTANLDLSGAPGFWLPQFSAAEFDGAAHVISNPTINVPFVMDPVGLFGYLGAGTAVKNIGVEGGGVRGIYYVGGLVGRNYGTVDNSYSTGAVIGSNTVGGLVGYNTFGGTISNSYSTGAVNGGHYVGGLVGRNYGTVDNSYSTGGINGSGTYVGGLVGSNDSGTVSNSYSAGAVTGGSYVGGLVGYNNYGTVKNSHYDIDQVAINGGHYVTLGGLYDVQYQDWTSHGLALNISDYASTLPFDSASGYYTIGAIQGLKDLLGFAEQPGYKFRLAADLDLSGAAGFWLPQFSAAEFDGAGHVISTLAVKFPFTVDRVGLFGYIGTGTTVKNIGVQGGSVTASDYAGGLVGYNDRGTVGNSYSTAAVNGRSYVGGLVGYNNYGTVSNSYSTSAVNGNGGVGGLVGSNYGTVSNSYGAGAVTGSYTVGGLVGYNYGTVSNSYSAGAVNGGSNYVGGLVGYQYGIVSNSHYDIDQVLINGGHYVTLGGLYHAQYQDWVSHGLALNIADYASTLPSDGAGYYMISSDQGLKDLLGFAEQPGYKFRLTGDLDLSGAAGFWLPQFSAAEFDGAGHVISNPTINFPFTVDRVGLFGSIGFGTTVKNIGVEGGSVTGYNYVGGLVGYNSGTVSNSYSTAAVNGRYFVGGLVGYNNFGGTMSNSYSNAAVNGNSQVGGLVGSNDGIVSNSYSAGAVNGDRFVGGLVGYDLNGSVSNSYSTGAVTGNSYVGGLVGYNRRTISNSYSTGAVTGSSYVGGLAGYNSGTVSNSYWDTTTSGQSTSSGGTGLTTAQMMQQASFVGFDFANTWRIYDGHTYPLLKSFLAPLTVTANDLSMTYNKTPYSGGNGVTYSDGSAVLSGILSYGGDSQGAVNAGSYTLAPTGLWSTQYDISYANGTFTINPAPLTIAAVSASKTYDGTSATFAAPTVLGLVTGDTVSGQTEAFTSKNVLGTNGSTLIVTGYTVSDGNGGANYIVSTQTATGTITPAALSISTSDVIKTYDGTTSANGTAISTASTQLFGTDSLSGGSFAFTDKNAGTNKTVTVGGVMVNDDNGGGNYLVSYANNTTSTINQALLTANIAGNPTKVYDGTTAITLASDNFNLTGVVSGESVVLGNTPTAGNYNSPNVSQANTVTANLSGASFTAGSGTLLSNYLLPPTAVGPGQITPATLTYRADHAIMGQGGTIPLLSGTVNGFVAGETQATSTTGTLTWVTNATPTSDVGPYYSNGQGLAANYGNYVFVQAPSNKAALTVTRCNMGGGPCP